MNKRAVIEDWGNMVVAIVFSILILWFFWGYVAGDTVKKSKDVQDRDEQLIRERFLINYLRTPVSQTELVVKNLPISDQTKPALEYAIKNNLTIADVLRLIPTNILFEDVVLRVTYHDNDLSKNQIVADMSQFNPGWKDHLLSKGRSGCSGKTSVASIPIESGNPIIITVTSCPQEEQKQNA